MPRSAAVINAAMACSVSAGDVNVEERALRNADGLEEQHDVVLRSAGGPDTTEVDDTLVLPAEVVDQAPDLRLGPMSGFFSRKRLVKFCTKRFPGDVVGGAAGARHELGRTGEGRVWPPSRARPLGPT